MAVRLRLKRFGRKHRAVYRLGAFDGRQARNAEPIEELGFYDPCAKDPAQSVNLKKDRIEYWLGVGALPSETVAALLQRNGIGRKPARAEASA